MKHVSHGDERKAGGLPSILCGHVHLGSGLKCGLLAMPTNDLSMIRLTMWCTV